MRISDVAFTHFRHALDPCYGDAQGIKRHRAGLLIRVQTDTGPTGWGEVGDSRLDVNLSHLRQARDLLRGADPLAAAPLVRRLAAFGPRIAAGIELALADIRGQAAGMSLATLLGGAHRASQPCYASLQNAAEGIDPVSHNVAEARRAVALGFRHVKMKVGWHDPATDARWIDAVLEALPAEVMLAIDANRVLDLRDAVRLIGLVRQPERLSWFEEPCGNRHPAAYAELRARIRVPVAGGESMAMPMLEQVIAGRMMDIVQPDLVGHGGFAAMQRLFTLCDVHGVRLVPHCFDGQVMRVGTLHLLAAQPDWEERHGEYEAAPLEVDISPSALRDELLGGPLSPDADGRMPVPTAPGLGVTVNADYVARAGVAVTL